MTPRELAVLWRTEAETVGKYDERLAAVLQRHADDLDAALHDVDEDALDLETAAKESGYSPDRLRHMVSDGTIPNAGRRGAPRIRRADLPRKRRASGREFDATTAARQLLGSQ